MTAFISLLNKEKPVEILLSSLPDGWDAADTLPFTKRLGDKFLNENGTLMLSVPCVPVPEEFNFLLNPLHRDMRKVKLVHKRRIYVDKRIHVNK